MLNKIKNLFNRNNMISLVSGLSLVFAYAPFSYYWLPFIAIPLWLNTLNKLSVKQASSSGFFFGVGWFTAGISWVHVSIEQFGGMPLIVSLLLMLLLCLYLALFPMLACFLAARFTPKKQINLWLLPATWTLSELLRSNLLTGFPWLSLGYSQIDSPFAVIAPIFGEVGITFGLLVFCIALLTTFTAKGSNKVLPLTITVVISVSLIVLTKLQWLTPSNQNIKTALVQGNIEQELKWRPEQEWPTLLNYLNLTKEHLDTDIIVWPESAIPALEPQVQDYLATVNDLANLNDNAVITGILNYNLKTRQYFNGLIVLGQKQANDKQGNYSYNHDNRFYKHHLLPIGEFVPFESILRPLAPFFNLPQSSFSRGNYIQNNLIAKGQHLLPVICFEIAFPEQIAANFTPETSMLLTVSNDAWFADSHGPHQHMEIARMRALEFGRPLLRSTNTGITATVDAHGKIINQLPQFEQAVLTSEIPLVKGYTPFSQWQKYPIFILATLLFFIVSFYQRKNNIQN